MRWVVAAAVIYFLQEGCGKPIPHLGLPGIFADCPLMRDGMQARNVAVRKSS
jgi:hypothetical protein